MTTMLNIGQLTAAAENLAVQTAQLLPREESEMSLPFQEKMNMLLWRAKRQQKRRTLWQRGIAALLALAQGASALVWMDEAAQELFILVGGDGDMLQKMAESIY